MKTTSACCGVDPVFTVREVAAHLKASERTVWKIIKAGQMATIRRGRLVRVSGSALSLFLKESTCG